jgi:hypothetical protein
VPGHVERRAGPKPFIQQDGELALASATKSEMVSNWTHHKRRKGKTVAASRASYAHYGAGLRGTHIRRRAPSDEIFTRRREDVNDLGVFGEKTLMLDVARNYRNITPDHRPPIVSDAEVHPTVEHPNNLLVRMLVRSGMCARLHFPPHDYALFPGKHTPLNFIGDALPRRRHQRLFT